MSETSPLYDREVRNVWEHFDERLDVFLLNYTAGTFFPNPIVGSIVDSEEPTNHFFKLLDPVEDCLVLLGKKYNFVEIYSEVKRILVIADQADMNGGRLRFK